MSTMENAYQMNTDLINLLMQDRTYPMSLKVNFSLTSLMDRVIKHIEKNFPRLIVSKLTISQSSKIQSNQSESAL